MCAAAPPRAPPPPSAHHPPLSFSELPHERTHGVVFNFIPELLLPTLQAICSAFCGALNACLHQHTYTHIYIYICISMCESNCTDAFALPGAISAVLSASGMAVRACVLALCVLHGLNVQCPRGHAEFPT